MSSGGNGGKDVMPDGDAGSQVFSRPSGKITGMRSCTGRITSLASVVRIANVNRCALTFAARIDAGHRERLVTFHNEAIRLLAAGCRVCVPLIETVSEDEAVPAGIRRAEHLFFSRGLKARVVLRANV